MQPNNEQSLVPSGELRPLASGSEKQAEIQAAITVARAMPRNENAVTQRLASSCNRVGFAENAAYKFPRGASLVTGPSVRFAREFARLWGNVRYGVDVVTDTEEARTIKGWAWDLETNTRVEMEDSFRKLVYRKNSGGQGGTWIKPDERQLREETNRRAAILERNCILKVSPPDVVEDALSACETTLKAQASGSNAAKVIDQVIQAFAGINVSLEQIEKKLGHALIKSTPTELTDLRLIYKSIQEGQSKWSDYTGDTVTATARTVEAHGTLDMSKLSVGTEENRGHGDEGLSKVGKKK